MCVYEYQPVPFRNGLYWLKLIESTLQSSIWMNKSKQRSFQVYLVFEKEFKKMPRHRTSTKTITDRTRWCGPAEKKKGRRRRRRRREWRMLLERGRREAFPTVMLPRGTRPVLALATLPTRGSTCCNDWRQTRAYFRS